MAPVTAARNPTELVDQESYCITCRQLQAYTAKAAKARLRAKVYRAAVLAVAGPRATAHRE